MKLKLRVATLDTLPKELQGFYRPMDGGGFILDHEPDPDGYGIDNLSLIRGKLDEKSRDHDRATKRLKGFEKPDGSLVTPEEYQATVQQLAELTRTLDTLKDKTKSDDQKLQQMVADAKRPLEAEIAKHKQKAERYRSGIERGEKERAVDEMIEILKPEDRWRGFLRSELARHIEVVENEEDGTWSRRVVDPETGRPRMSSLTGRDGPMDVSEFAKGSELRQKFGPCLKGDGKKGADVTAQSPQSGPQQGGDRNVHLPFEHSQSQFESAYEQARKQGGEVIIAEATS